MQNNCDSGMFIAYMTAVTMSRLEFIVHTNTKRSRHLARIFACCHRRQRTHKPSSQAVPFWAEKVSCTQDMTGALFSLQPHPTALSELGGMCRRSTSVHILSLRAWAGAPYKSHILGHVEPANALSSKHKAPVELSRSFFAAS